MSSLTPADRQRCTACVGTHRALLSPYMSVSTTGLGGGEDRYCDLLISVFPGLSTESGQNNKGGWEQVIESAFPATVHLKKIRVIDCLRFLARMEVLLIIQIGQLRNHNLLDLSIAGSAVTIESIMMSACEQAI